VNLNDFLEQELCAGYAQEEAIYSEALTLAERITLAVAKGEEADALLTEIGTLLRQIGKLETELDPCKERWRREGAHPGPELHARLGNVALLIRQMQEHLDRALGDAQRHKAALGPELDGLALRRKGRRAYGGGDSHSA
jgi:hypothetical protein